MQKNKLFHLIALLGLTTSLLFSPVAFSTEEQTPQKSEQIKKTTYSWGDYAQMAAYTAAIVAMMAVAGKFIMASYPIKPKSN